MEYTNLYILEENDISGSDLVYNITKSFNSKDNMSTFRFSESFGSKYYDLIFNDVSSFLFSSKIINLLLENNITGWKAHPAIIYNKDNIIEGYSFFEVKGRCGSIDWTNSEEFKKQFVLNSPYADMLRGIYPNLSLWDGSDFFIAEGTLFIFVTQKVKDLFISNKITNVKFTKITEYEIIKLSPLLNSEIEEQAKKFFK